MLCDTCIPPNRDGGAGNCQSCKRSVSSALYKLCTGCAKMRGQCRCCKRGVLLIAEAISSQGGAVVGAALRFIGSR